MNPLEFFLVFFKASAITFAGLGSLPILQEDLVQVRGWATDEQILKAVAVGRFSPGPNGMYVVSIGYLVMGWPGALLALLGAVLPPLVVLPLAPLVRRGMHLAWVNGTMRGIGIGSAGLLVAVGISLIDPWGQVLGVLNPWNVALGTLGFLMTRTGRLHPVVVLGTAAAVGIIASLAGL